MVPQLFELSDAGTIAVLILLEALLSADNALVLAIMVRHLPRNLQRKALMYGLGGAFVLRSIAIILAAYIISFWWLQLIGALYLLFLPIKHFMAHGKGKEIKVRKASFWATVAQLELVDVAFALDSVIVAVALVDTVNRPEKLWVVIAGAVLGIIILRFAAHFFIRILERYPVLDHVAYLLVGWAGVKLTFISGRSFEHWYDTANPASPLAFSFPEMPKWLFWTGMAIIAVGGTFYALRHKADSEVEESMEDAADAIEEAVESDDSPSTGSAR